jgi:mycothiol synthase
MMTATTLPAGYTLRRPTMDDVHALFEVECACQMAEYGELDMVEEDTRSDLLNQHLDEDMWVVTGEDGAIVAFAGVHPSEYGRLFAQVRVAPKHRRKGIGAALAALVTARAEELTGAVPAGRRVTLNGSIHSKNDEARRFIEREGFAQVRYFWRMQIDMMEEPPAPEWPEGIVVRTFERGRDEHAVFDAEEAAFADHWGHTPNKFEEYANWTYNREDFDPSLWFLAVEQEHPDTIAGIALDWRDPYQGWVGQLGVLRAYRRRGLAEALLRESFGAFWRRGERKVVLGVDAQSLTGAVRLYERVGMRAVRQWDSFSKELRAGRDLATMTLDAE